MNISEEQLTLIQKYLSSGLDSGEQTTFNKNLESLDFREELMSQARLIDSLTEVDASLIKDSLQEVSIEEAKPVNEPVAVPTHRPQARPQSSRRWFMLAGAMVFLMAALWIMFKPDSQPASTPLYQMAEAYNTPLPPGLQQRGGADQVEATEAIQAYANESYEKALKLFQAKANPTKADQLYLSNWRITCYR